MQVNITALGCRVNEAELESWAQKFRSRGHTLTNDPVTADVLVVNTCAVTLEAVRKSRQLLRRAHRYNPRAKLVVSGCFASLEKKNAETIEGVDLVIDNRDKDQLVEITLRELAVENMPTVSTLPGEFPLFTLGRHRAFIKIQDGCRYQCTFCIVTTARGPERSRSIQDIIDEISIYSAQGIKEAVLTGVHAGGYGSDSGSSLDHLITAILNETDIPRLRLASVEPWDLADEFFTLFRNPRLMPHIHLPLQSGSDSVLKRMARRTMTGDFEHIVERARTEVEDMNITTDVIVGFPGETKQEWEDSLEFIRKTGFSHIHIFTYSGRAGTRAATMPDQIPLSIRKQRSQELYEVARETRYVFMKQQVGKQYPVLWEAPRQSQGTEYCSGYTPNYLRVQLPAPGGINLENQISRVRIAGVDESGDVLYAESALDPVTRCLRQ